MTAVDVGAHIGYYTCLFTKLVGSYGKVYAFEPHYKNFDTLKNNVKRFKNVFIIQNAVMDREKEVILYESLGAVEAIVLKSPKIIVVKSGL
jgi:FkbM family methyltransferase